MKILIASRSVAHFPYYSSIVRELNRDGHETILIHDVHWSAGQNLAPLFDYALKCNKVKLRWLTRRSDKHRESIFRAREIRTYLNYAKHKEQSPYYKERWGSYIPRYARLLPIGTLPLLEWYEKKTPPDARILEELRKMRPDVVVACPANHRFSEEIEYVKAAKELNIPTVIVNYSWDNLTTKGLYHVKPDYMFVWNYRQTVDAVKWHGIDHNNVYIIGAPFFDKWFSNGATPVCSLLSRHELCKKLGINYLKPYILYLGSSAKIAEDETDVINQIKERFKGIEVIFRPHPANYKRYVWDKNLKMFPRDVQVINSGQDRTEFLSCLKYSLCAFGINNSAMIDAIVNDKPVVTLLKSKYLDTQYKALHFIDMSPALYCSGSMNEVARHIKNLSTCEDPKQEDRKLFIKKYIRPHGFSAGRMAANLINDIGGTCGY